MVILNLNVEIFKIKGKCLIYKEGDVFNIKEGYKLYCNSPICMHSLASLMPYYIALSRGITPESLSLGKGVAHLQCLDPCEYTGGGTVIFKVRTTK